MYATKTKQPETANSYIAKSLSSLDIIETTSHRTIKLYCEHCGEIKEAIMKCADRTCEFCRKRIYYKLLNGWIKLVKNMQNPKLLTLTTVNVEKLQKSDVQNIRKAFSKFIRQKYYKERIVGGLYVIEIKNIGNGWNIHLHALIDTVNGDLGYVDQRKISEDWLKVTGTSKIVDIRKARNPQISLRYILKYLMKTPEINGEVDAYNAALRGSRLIQTFGNLYRKKPEKSQVKCDKCGNDIWMTDYEFRKIAYIPKESHAEWCRKRKRSPI